MRPSVAARRTWLGSSLSRVRGEAGERDDERGPLIGQRERERERKNSWSERAATELLVGPTAGRRKGPK